MAFMTSGEGGLAVAELRALGAAPGCPLGRDELHYWLGLAHLLAFDWGGVMSEMRSYLATGANDWRAGWAYLHLGRAFERAGHTDEASLAYRGCLTVSDAERATRKLAFDLMTKLVATMPMGYGQASSRPASS
jgi:hypothetical protein